VVKRLGAAACLLLAAAAARADELSEAVFLADLPEVLTASRLAQPLADAPSAITVIDRALIEASGFREIADLLRLVPGFYVGYVTGNQPIAANAADPRLHAPHAGVGGRSLGLPADHRRGIVERLAAVHRRHRAHRGHARAQFGQPRRQRFHRRDQHHHPSPG
jgi:iron complex outermembrane receptor protein